MENSKILYEWQNTLIFEGKSELLELRFYIELKVEITVIPRFIKRQKKVNVFIMCQKN